MMRRDNKLSYQVPRNKTSILSNGMGSDNSQLDPNEYHSNMSDNHYEDQFENQTPLMYSFNPKQFYWLFNPYIKFNKRKGFCIEGEIQSMDFLMMRDINRKNLTAFIMKAGKEKQQLDNGEDERGDQMFNSIINSESEMSSPQVSQISISPNVRHSTQGTRDAEVSSESLADEAFDDKQIDNAVKDLLKERRHGKIIPPDTLAHLEFFYNTL